MRSAKKMNKTENELETCLQQLNDLTITLEIQWYLLVSKAHLMMSLEVKDLICFSFKLFCLLKVSPTLISRGSSWPIVLLSHSQCTEHHTASRDLGGHCAGSRSSGSYRHPCKFLRHGPYAESTRTAGTCYHWWARPGSEFPCRKGKQWVCRRPERLDKAGSTQDQDRVWTEMMNHCNYHWPESGWG